MKFSVIIPARYASTRFPGKPLADVAGKPMVVRVAERARKSGAAEVIIATDHPRIAAVAGRHGFEAVMTSRGHVSGTDRIAEVAARRRYPGQHIVVNVQGDEPLIEPSLIRRVAADLAYAGAEAILMTEKDAVKCRHFAAQTFWELAVDAVPDPALGELIQGRLKMKG